VLLPGAVGAGADRDLDQVGAGLVEIDVNRSFGTGQDPTDRLGQWSPRPGDSRETGVDRQDRSVR
jgi:hypothetical protein